MISFLRVICCIVLIALSGCASHQKVSVINPKSVEQCMMTCMQHHDYCKQNCVNNCPNCSAAASETAAVNLFKYVHEKQVEGGYITRGLNSYRDPLQCRKVSCNCVADLFTCKQGCTGVIQKRLRSVPLCS